MRKIDEIKHPMSCLNRARDDEPIFVLRAHDPVAPATVRFWAERYRDIKMSAGNPDGFTERNQKKYAEAIMLADVMADWHARDERVPKRAPNRVPVGDPQIKNAQELAQRAANLGRDDYDSGVMVNVEYAGVLEQRVKELEKQLDDARMTIGLRNDNVARLTALKDGLIKDNLELTKGIREARDEVQRAIEQLNTIRFGS